jgi:hypothetical protein
MSHPSEADRGAGGELLVGRGVTIERVPAAAWRQKLAEAPHSTDHRFAFMTADHRNLRYAAVRLLPKNEGRPLSVAQLSRATSLSESRVVELLDDLQRHLFFLVRNADGDVSWAFPVTTDATPHRLTFTSGERLWGA